LVSSFLTACPLPREKTIRMMPLATSFTKRCPMLNWLNHDQLG